MVNGHSWKEYIIHMVSQKWLTEADVDETEWWHWLTIVIPNDVKEKEALLLIGGGDQSNKIPQSANPVSIKVALTTKSIVADISNIPFQPLVFKNDGFGERVEDELISFGWRKFLEGGPTSNFHNKTVKNFRINNAENRQKTQTSAWN